MQRLHPLKLSKEIRNDDLRQRDGPVFLPLAVVDGQHASIKVEIMNPQFQALKQPKPAAVERLHDQVIGRIGADIAGAEAGAVLDGRFRSR